MGDMIDVAIENNIIQKAGSWFSFGSERIGQGRDAVRAYLKEYPDAFAAVEKAVKEKLGILPAPAPTNGAAPAEEKSTKKK
jgi:recombination protein RecA